MPHRQTGGGEILAQDGELIVLADPARLSGRLLRQAGMDASYIDLADTGHLEFDYLRWMRVVLAAAHARRVLHIGGAGCALARALAGADPGGRQDVFEIDPAVVACAREHLGLRRAPGLRVRVGDGVVALSRADDGSRHAVVIDAFVDGRVAPGPVAPGALAHAARVAPLCLLNVVGDRAGGEVARLAAGLGDVFGWVWTITGRSQNTVLVAGRGSVVPDRAVIGAQLARDRSPASVQART